jgi:hypothetical protein
MNAGDRERGQAHAAELAKLARRGRRVGLGREGGEHDRLHAAELELAD